MRRWRHPLTRTPARTFISAAEEEKTNHSGGHVPFLSPLIKAASRHGGGGGGVEEEEEDEGRPATLTPLTPQTGGEGEGLRGRRVAKNENEELVKGTQSKDSTRRKAD